MTIPSQLSRTLLDLDWPFSWPAALLAYLNRHHDLFLQWETKRGNILCRTGRRY